MFKPDNAETRQILTTVINNNKVHYSVSDLSTLPPTTTGLAPVPNGVFIYKYSLQSPNTTRFGIEFSIVQGPLKNHVYQTWSNFTTSANGTDHFGDSLLSFTVDCIVPSVRLSCTEMSRLVITSVAQSKGTFSCRNDLSISSPRLLMVLPTTTGEDEVTRGHCNPLHYPWEATRLASFQPKAASPRTFAVSSTTSLSSNATTLGSVASNSGSSSTTPNSVRRPCGVKRKASNSWEDSIKIKRDKQTS
ncbi:hypothetical protein BGX24_002737 [Mortierella sp. AD032]|nr:hypothetical protein BGX24_002737 [Mortierella sp. AD032]